MPNSASIGVQHGLQSWVDYDRPWILRRQFLVSERNASILSNLVAMALTLVGPRLWILIKAFSFWAIGFYERRFLTTRTSHAQSDLPLTSSSSTSIDPAQHDIPLRNLAMSDGYAAFKNSHSELGAAMELIRGVWDSLRMGRIELSTNRSSGGQRQTIQKLQSSWMRFLRQPVDILISLAISAALIGLFVAQSSGSVLSASIVSDSIALASSSSCAAATDNSVSSLPRAVAYVTKCYHAKQGADGCNFFYNQTIAYTEKANQTCPFTGQTCARGKNSAVTFDTGLIDAKLLGINAAKHYQFRRKMLCAPLVPDGDFIKLYPPSNSMRTNLSSLNWIISGNMGRYKGAKGMFISKQMSGLTAPIGIAPLDFPGKSFNSSFVTIFEIVTPGMEYFEFRDDPVFPAIHYQNGVYSNNSTVPGLLGCVNSAFVYDPDLDQCWNWPETVVDIVRQLSDPIRNEHDGVVTNADIALVLLSSAISGSFQGIDATTDFHLYTLEAQSHCLDLYCDGLPREQWKVEARQLFEIFLVNMQYRVLDIVRGGDDDSDHGRYDLVPPSGERLPTLDHIPPNLRGICHMGKFRSVGWRNVSVWGFLGLLSLAGAISLASITTEDEELWLVVGARLLNRALQWGMRLLRKISWLSTSKRILHSVSTIPAWLARTARHSR